MNQGDSPGAMAGQPNDRKSDEVGVVDCPADAKWQEGVGDFDEPRRIGRLPEGKSCGDRDTYSPDVFGPDGAPKEREGSEAGEIRKLSREPIVECCLKNEVVKQEYRD